MMSYYPPLGTDTTCKLPEEMPFNKFVIRQNTKSAECAIQWRIVAFSKKQPQFLRL